MTRRLYLPAAYLAASLLWGSALGAGVSSVPANDEATLLLLGESYPLEAPISFPAALLHWLDSLAHLRGSGLTGGKTVEAHRQAYVQRLAVPTAEDQRLLEAYHRIRLASASSNTNDPYALTRAFFEAGNLGEALKKAGALLAEQDYKTLKKAVLHYGPRYRNLWNDGEVPRSFVKRIEQSEQREKLARFLADVAAFYGVAPDADPRPRLVLAPVPAGYGTHAQAIDRFLLVEVRRGDALQDQIAPIVHENAHLLYQRMGTERIAALEAAAKAHGSMGQAAWLHLKEALPTSIAQGLAQLTFGVQGWSLQALWYDVEVVDVFAKKIFPNVKRAMTQGRTLDPALIDELVEVYARSVAPRRLGTSATTPRSP